MAELTDVKGVSESRAENLHDEGFTSVDDVAEADPEDLEEVHGVGSSTADDLIESAQEVITEEHIDTDETDEEEEGDREEVGLEDVEQINEEPPEGYNEPVDTEDEEDEVEEAEEVEQEGPETFSVTLDVSNDEQYDYFLKSLIDMKLERSSNDQATQNAIQKALGAVRPLGGEGSIEIELTANELNRLHSAVQQAETRHQSNRETDAFNEMRDLKAQVDEERSEHLF